jgi:hypothetical protein
MTRKYYKMLARLIREREINYVGLPTALADILEEDNPRFNRELFLKACKGEQK